MNLADYKEIKAHYKKRVFWILINKTLFRLIPGHALMRVRNRLLRYFGAEIDNDACVYSSVTIFAPWNLKLGRACIGPRVNLYNKDFISIGNVCVISQDSIICTASHDISSLMLPPYNKPITIEDNVWVASHVFIGMGVTIGQGAVVGARAAVFRDVEPWTVVGGNPAKFIKKRIIKE